MQTIDERTGENQWRAFGQWVWNNKKGFFKCIRDS